MAMLEPFQGLFEFLVEPRGCFPTNRFEVTVEAQPLAKGCTPRRIHSHR
jgi:hypothetical protein